MNCIKIPKEITDALRESVNLAGCYPDYQQAGLREALSRAHNIPAENILTGNGASELLMAVVHGLAPKRAVIPVPSFFGYRHALDAVRCDVTYVHTYEDDLFIPGHDFSDKIINGTDLCIIANPGNPSGRLLDKKYILSLADKCREAGGYLLVDECFMELSDRDESVVGAPYKYDNLFILKAFTKSYGLPGEGEVDPTGIMAIFYYFLFGLMLSDAGYGLLMVVGCGIVLKKFPKMSRSMKQMMTMFF